MKRIETPEALEVVEELQKETGETVVIYKGQPDARSLNGFHAYCKTWKGFSVIGEVYGLRFRSSKSLRGLLD